MPEHFHRTLNFHKPLRSKILAALVALGVGICGTSPSSLAQTSDLPELGDDATQYLNSAQEKVIGQGFFLALKNDPNYVDDYELRAYIQGLGDSVGQVADLRDFTLTFSMIQDNNLNAFAVPGGYITFNTGLLMATASENELASVVGHEIAHLTQRHLARLVEKAEQSKLPAMAAILASILVGGQAGLAGITATNATLASNQLSYSRDFEREADAIGIRLLAESGYDPRAMAEFFGKLEKYTRHDSTRIPEFLRTHPLSFARVAESQTRAADYPAVDRPSSFEYYLAKARIRASHVERQDDPALFFADDRASDNELVRDAASYGAAIHLASSRDYPAAIDLAAPLAEKYPDHPWIGTLIAELDIANGQGDAAIARYERLLTSNPGNLLLAYHLAEAYLETGQPALAKKEMRYYIRRNPDTYPLYKLLSKANAELGHLAEAHQAKAEYHAILGDYEVAVSTLRLALREAGDEGYLKSSLRARLTEMEEKLRLQNAVRNG